MYDQRLTGFYCPSLQLTKTTDLILSNLASKIKRRAADGGQNILAIHCSNDSIGLHCLAARMFACRFSCSGPWRLRLRLRERQRPRLVSNPFQDYVIKFVYRTKNLQIFACVLFLMYPDFVIIATVSKSQKWDTHERPLQWTLRSCLIENKNVAELSTGWKGQIKMQAKI